MVFMDNEVTGRQVCEGIHPPPVLRPLEPLDAPALLPLALGEHGPAAAHIVEAGGQSPHGDGHPAGLRQIVELEVHRRAQLPLPQQGLEVQGPLFAGYQHHRGRPGILKLGQVGGRSFQVDPKGGQLPGLDGQQRPGGQRGGGGGEGV